MTQDEALEYLRCFLRVELPAATPTALGTCYTFRRARVTILDDGHLHWERVEWSSCTDVEMRAALSQEQLDTTNDAHDLIRAIRSQRPSHE